VNKLGLFGSFQELKEITHGKTVGQLRELEHERQFKAIATIAALEAADQLNSPRVSLGAKLPTALNSVDEAEDAAVITTTNKQATRINSVNAAASRSNIAAQKLNGRTLIVDENLSPKLATELQSKGYNVKTFSKGTLDPEIINYAKQNNAIVLTNNIKDFKNQGITTMKVTEKMKKASEVGNVVKAIENISIKASTDAGLIKSGSNLNLSQHQ